MLGQLVIHMQSREAGSLPCVLWKKINDLTVKLNHTQFSEENIKGNRHHLEFISGFLDDTENYFLIKRGGRYLAQWLSLLGIPTSQMECLVQVLANLLSIKLPANMCPDSQQVQVYGSLCTRGRPGWGPSSWLWPGLILAIEGFWGVNQWMDDLSNCGNGCKTLNILNTVELSS